MATQVNSQITDAVTQTNVEVVSSSSSVAMGSLLQTLSHSLSLTMENAVSNQQQLNTLNIATTASCVEYLLKPTKSDKKNKK